MFEINNLAVSFGDKRVIEDLSFKIEEGDFVIVTGESGCGKSTLLNCISFLERYTSGDIVYKGNSYNKMRNRDKMKNLKTNFGIVFQDFGLVEDLSVYKNISYVNKNKSRIKEAFEELNLDIDMNLKTSLLSGGEKQRVALARIILKRCNVILADEPTGNLDDANATIIMEHLKKLNQKGKTIILVTHDKKLLSYGNKFIEL